MLDSIESYALGFAMGDGSLKCRKDGTPRCINFYSTDKEFLERLGHHFGVDIRMSMDPRRYSYAGSWKASWCFSSPVSFMDKALGGGYTKDKENHSFPTGADILPFLLGFLDADGSIHLRNTRGGKVRTRLLDSVAFLGRFRLLKGISEWLKQEGFKSAAWKIPLREGKRVQLYTVRLGAKSGFRLLQAMYSVSPICLERKKSKFLEIEPWYSRPVAVRTWCMICEKKREIDQNGKCRSCSRVCS